MPTTTPLTKHDPITHLARVLGPYARITPVGLAEHLDAALRSAVRAVVPGRQQQRNLAPLMQLARRAFTRTLRRRAR